ASFSLVIIFLLITFVIPSLEMIFEEREVNHFTQAVISTSRFLNRYWALYLPLFFANFFGWTLFFRGKRGKLLLHHLFIRTPLVKSLITQAAIARFCRTMETLLHGGVTIIDALRISRKVMKNPLLEEVVEHAEQRIVEGSLLSVELRQSKLIPPLVPRMLAIGEESGNSAKMLHKIADLYEEEVEKSLNRLMALAQPVILLIMGLVVGMIMLAVLLPLTDINAFISG
nr:Type II secretion system protein F [Chlamydiota bacterium]